MKCFENHPTRLERDLKRIEIFVHEQEIKNLLNLIGERGMIIERLSCL